MITPASRRPFGVAQSCLRLLALYTTLIGFAPGAPAADERGVKQLKVIEELTGSAIVDPPRFWFLGIGIDRYTKWPRLETPARDVTAVRDVLIEKYLFEPARAETLLDRSATHAAIDDAFARLVRELRDTDMLVVYYAGHGITRQETGYGYWIPVDGDLEDSTTWIKNQDIVDYVSNMKARHVLLVSDSCFAGSFFATQRGGGSDEPLPDEILSLYARRSRAALTSGGMEPVLDKGSPNSHSVFADFLLQVLNNNPWKYLVPSDRDFLGTIRTGLRQNAPQQPQYGSILQAAGSGGEFVFFQAAGRVRERLHEDGTEGSPQPPDANAFLFSSPAGGRLTLQGKPYTCGERAIVYLAKGRYPFTLEVTGQHTIHGIMEVQTVDDDTRLAQFGAGTENALFAPRHLQGAWSGQPVRHTISLNTPDGSKKVMTYVMSLNPIKSRP